MTDSLADQIRAQAAISARPGQLVALEALAARVAELEHERDFMREMLRAAAVQAVAAQRPPLGYVVLAKRPHRSEPGEFDYRPVGSIWGEREPAESDAGAWQDAAIADRKRYGNVEYVLGEVREAQP
ncbi:hypothetical protein [Nocardia asiatica]|uniref:hypothetical protein n=1 Tax=Nocardia asiatica TaxID=209252 RepID=UPI0002E4D289|nr:hypothetical protein [Nocardia asiatica]